MKRLLIVPIILLAFAACQTPQPAPASTATALPPTVTPTPVPVEVTTAPPAVVPTAEPTVAPAVAPTTAPTAAPTSTPLSGTADAYVNSLDGLNLRAEPSAAARLLRTLPFDTHLTTIGPPTAPDAAGIVWQNVRTDDGPAGWVAAQYLSSARPAPPQASPPVTPATPVVSASYVYIASVGGLNMRAAAAVSSPILTMLANGQRLQTNGLTSGPDSNSITWLNVRTDDGLEGWVSVQFVSEQVPSVAPAAPPANVSDAVAEILRRTNEFRQQNGVTPVILNADLTRTALEHSQYMAQNGITHTGAGGLSAKQRIANAGYGAGRPTENIYGGEASIDDAWTYWATDPPHRDVLLNPFNTVVGIGVYQVGRSTYYTMDFGKPAE